jgi:hypothetical protein
MVNKIYRIQDKDGRGPWKPGFSHLWVESRLDHENLIPCFIEFRNVKNLSVYGMHLGCGCLTKEQLKRWFTKKEYAKLLGYGYQSVEMEVGRILGKSNIQCVFERSKPLNKDVFSFDLYPVEPQKG